MAIECTSPVYVVWRSFDNAEVYAKGQAETIMGQAIKELGWKRSDLVISTKIFWGGDGPNDTGLSRKHIIEGTQVFRMINIAHALCNFMQAGLLLQAVGWMMQLPAQS